jgi:hypothetical protein
VSARLQLVVARHYLFCCQRSVPLPLNDSHVERQEATLLRSQSAGFCLSGVLLGCASLPESRTVLFFILLRFAAFLVGLGRLELPTSPLSGVRSNHLSYRPNSRGPEGWWSWSGSNRRPPECKSGALPAELQPPSRVKERLSRPIGRRVSSDLQRTPEITVRTVSSGDPKREPLLAKPEELLDMEGNGCHLLLHSGTNRALSFQ